MDFVFVKSQRAGRECFGSVYVRLRTKGMNKKFSLGITIHEEEWNRYKSLVSGKTDGTTESGEMMKSIGISYKMFMEVLSEVKSALDNKYYGRNTAAVIRSAKASILNGEGLYVPQKEEKTGGILLVDFMQRYAEELESGKRLKKGGTRCVTTDYIQGIRVVAKATEQFQQERRRKVWLDNATMTFAHDFAKWNRGKGIYPNTINSRMTKIRTVMREAFEEHLTKCDDFRRRGFVPKAEDVDHVFLTATQIDEMYNFPLTDFRDRLCRDAFIIGCLTGQRFSDFVRINNEMIMELEGMRFINLVQKKTGKKILIPLDKRITEILSHYEGSMPYITSQEMNKKLKTIAEKMGWTQVAQIDSSRMGCKKGHRFCDMIGTHTARRSFATNAYAAGIPLSSIMAVTGHSSEKNLRRYLKLQPIEKAIIAARDLEGIILTKKA